MSTMNLQSFLSMESEVVLTDEAVQQTQDDSQMLEEEIRRDVETVGDLVEERARAEKVIEEVEAQNEIIRNVVKQEGGLTPANAAFVEAARRASAVSLGLDPEDKQSSGLIDQAGLESMVENRGVIALEDNEKFIDKIKRWAAEAYEAIMRRIAAIKSLFTKLISKQPLRYKAALVKIKSITDKEFNEAVKELFSDIDAIKKLPIDNNGKLYRSDEEFKKLMGLNTALAKSMESVETALFRTLNKDYDRVKVEKTWVKGDVYGTQVELLIPDMDYSYIIHDGEKMFEQIITPPDADISGAEIGSYNDGSNVAFTKSELERELDDRWIKANTRIMTLVTANLQSWNASHSKILKETEELAKDIEAHASAEDLKKESFKLSKRNRELFQMYIKVTSTQLTIATNLVSRAMTTLPVIALKIANHALAKREQENGDKTATSTDIVPA